ncbi:MAG: hypothetical protein M3Y41_17620 [Pseudomonadota bacterium]|nr:hypothetical protein [Pseudomonadota bacterium]
MSVTQENTIVSTTLTVQGLTEYITAMQAARSATQSLNGNRATIQIDDSEAKAKVAGLTTQIQRVGSTSLATILKVDDGDAKLKIAGVQSEIKKLGAAQQTPKIDLDIASAQQKVQSLTRDLEMTRQAALAMGTAFAAAQGLKALIAPAEQYQTELQQIHANTTMVTADVATMDQAIRAMSKESGASLQELGAGFAHAFNFGNDAAASFQITDAAMKSAKSTGADVAATTNILSAAMHEFNQPASQAANTMDVLHLAAAQGNQTLEQFVGSAGRALATASNLGASLTESAAAMSALTRHGYDATEASTQLTNILTHIANPSKAAEAAIRDLSQRTGVDLVSDFSQAGLQSKGLAQILDDVSRATGGNSAEILKLIPALRGGLGAMVLATNGAKDYKEILAQLNQAQSGQIHPTEDAYAEYQTTAAAKAAKAEAAFKLAVIDAGQAALPVLGAIATAVVAIPAPLLQAAVTVGVFAAAVKGLETAGQIMQLLGAKSELAQLQSAKAAQTDAAASLEDAAARRVDATAAAEQATAIEAAATAQRGGLMGDVLGARLGGANRTINTGNATKVAMNVEAEAASVETSGLLASVRGKLAGLSLGDIAMQGTIVLALAEGAQMLDKAMVDRQVGPLVAQYSESFKAGLATALAANPDDYGAAFDAAVKGQEQKLAQMKADQGNFHGIPNPSIPMVGRLLPSDTSDAEIQAQTQLLDQLHQKQQEVNGAPLGPPLPPNYNADLQTATDNVGKLDAAAEEYQVHLQDMARYQAMGASNETISRGVFGVTGAGDAASKNEIANAKKDLTDLTAAWTGAGSAINGVDLSKGVAEFIKVDDKLVAARDDLAKFGVSNVSLSGLTGIADQFKAISDATDAASAAYNGYQLTLSNTDANVKILEDFKKRVDESVKAAQTAQANGTATPDQIALLNSAPDILGNIADQEARLQANAASDILGMAKNLPDLVTADNLTRNLVDRLGGGTTLEMTIKAEVAQAKADIEAVEKGPYTATIAVTTAGAGAPQAGPVFGPPLPPGYDGNTVPDAPPAAAASPPPAAAATISGSTGVPGGSWNAFHPMTKDEFIAAVNEGAGGKNSPFATDAGYASIEHASLQGGVDPRVILSFLQFENNMGTNISASQAAGNNFAGIKYAGQPGATAGAISPEGDPYAVFKTMDDFFAALTKNLTTGIYADAYTSGNLTQVARTYVTGGPTGTPDQEANISNRVNQYSYFAQKYPEPGGGAVQAAIESGGAATINNGQGDQIAATAKAHLGELYQATGQVWNMWCEKFADDIIQAATGHDFRADNPRDHLQKAMAGVPGAGRVLGPNEAPQPGDQAIMLPENTNNWTTYGIGHTGIVANDTSQFIGTSDKGIVTTKIPPGTIFIRPDGVVANGPAPGTQAVDANSIQPAASTASGPAPSVGTQDFTTPADPKYKPQPPGPVLEDPALLLKNMPDPKIIKDAAINTALLAETVKGLDSTGMQSLNSEMSKFGAYAKTAYEQAKLPLSQEGVTKVLDFKAHEEAYQQSQLSPTASSAEKTAADRRAQDATQKYSDQVRQQEADAAAQTSTLQFGQAFAQAMVDARDPTHDLTLDYERLSLLGGDMAKNAIAQVDNQRQIYQITADQLDATQKLKDLEASHTTQHATDQSAITAIQDQQTAAQQTRQAADEAASRTMTRQGWKDAQARTNTDNAHKAITDAESAQDTADSRTMTRQQWMQDQQRTDKERAYQEEVRQRTDLEQRMQKEWTAQQQEDARAKTVRDAAWQATTRQREDTKRLTDDAYTTLSRQEQDARTAAERAHTATMNRISDEQNALEEAHKLGAGRGSAQAQLQQAVVAGDTTSAARATDSVSLAITTQQNTQSETDYQTKLDFEKDAATAEDRRNQQALADLADQTTAASRAHEDWVRSFDLETTMLDRGHQDAETAITQQEQAETQSHQQVLTQMQEEDQARTLSHQHAQEQQQDSDKARQISDQEAKWAIEDRRKSEQVSWQQEQARQTATDTARSIADQEAKWRIQDRRQAEDASYKTQIDNATDLMKKHDAQYESDKVALTLRVNNDQKSLDTLKESQTYLGQAYDLWKGTAQYAGDAASTFLSVISGAPAVNPKVHGPTGDPNNPTNLGNVPGHAYGGTAQGLFTVGEHGTELMYSAVPMTVIPHVNTRQILSGGGTARPPSTFAPTFVADAGETLEQFRARVWPVIEEWWRTASPEAHADMIGLGR